MKRLILAIPILWAISVCPVLAQDSVPADNGIIWGGYLQANECLRLKGENDFSWQEYRWDIKAEVKPTTKSHFYGELWLRTWGGSNVGSTSDLTDKDKVSPGNIDLKEAYVDFYGFLFEKLDLRIGKQRIAWGTADKLNQTDNLNPKDLEEIWDFGRHLGSDGLKASYYLGDYTLTAVYIPLFTPAVLPRGDWASVLSPAMELPSGMTLKSRTDVVSLPRNNPEESSTAGLKLSKNLLGYDLSLSYIYGRDDLPMASGISIVPAGASGEVDITSELIYPRRRILGADLAGTVAKVGIWAEAAVVFPDRVTMVTDLSAFGLGIQETTVLDDDPYAKYVVGGDYTFKNGIYVNGQYLHGFIHERGKGNLEDYVMFRMERKFLEEKLKIAPIGGGVEIKDTDDIKNNYAVIYSPEISYKPVDNAEITLGLRMFEGKNTTTFGKVKDNNEMCLKAEYSF